jgi:hypothetical protein
MNMEQIERLQIEDRNVGSRLCIIDSKEKLENEEGNKNVPLNARSLSTREVGRDGSC